MRLRQGNKTADNKIEGWVWRAVISKGLMPQKAE
jgi:hypothetical protein